MSTTEVRQAVQPDVGPAYIRAIAPYQAGKPIEELAREFGLDPATIVKLASNENPLGMPASAQAAIGKAVAGLGRYPDPNGFDLKAALSSRYGVPADWITLGNGSNDLLELASLALLSPGASSVYSRYAFMVYRLATQARGARHIVVPAADYGHDLDAMFNAIDADTRLVFIANPNNPTGTFLAADQIARFLERVHVQYGDRVVVMLDEAYNEYLDPELRFDSARWVEQYPNLIVSRTFSKAYLRHLYTAGELLSFRLNSLHNLTYFLDLVRGARKAIADGTFASYKKEIEALYPEELEQAGTWV